MGDRMKTLNRGLHARAHEATFDQEVLLMTSAVLISTCALGFTIFSFWWLQARRGKLVGFAPTTYAGYLRDDLNIRLPVVVYNTGAKTRVVRALRLVLGPRDEGLMLDWQSFHRTIDPGSDSFLDLVGAYAVPGRSADTRYVTFSGLPLSSMPEPVGRLARLEVLTEAEDGWEVLSEFVLHLEHMEDPGVYIAHHNRPESCREDESQIARARFEELARRHGIPAPWASHG